MRRIFISFFLSILLLKYASSTDSACMTTEDLAGKTCAELEPQDNYLCVAANADNGLNDDKPCIEVQTCNLLSPDNSVAEGDKCANRRTLKAGYMCKTITVDGNDICHEYSPCMGTEDLEEAGKENCAELEPQDNYLCVAANADNGLNDDKPCIEVQTCNLLSPDNSVAEGDKCANRRTLKQGNHCKEITVNSEKKCKEVPACQGATPNPISYDNCKDLWTEDSSKKCVVNDDKSACKVAENCAEVKKEANDNVCGLFSTDSQICVLNGEGCKVAAECAEVQKKADDNVCGLFSTDSQICVLNGEGCKVAAECAEVKKGANAEVCGLFTAGTTKCVVADDGNGCKVAAECAEVKKGANAEVCGLFTAGTIKCVVADNGEECEPKTICGQETYVKGTTNCRDSVPNDNEVCVDTGSKCESQTPCGRVTYQEGTTDCTKLPTVDPNKICRKHQTEARCDEVTKPDNEEETGTKASEETGTNPGTKASEETGTNPSEETGTNPGTKASEETGTNPSEETGTNPGTKPNGEISPTQGTETDLSKDNKGMLLNLSLYTLLIYFLF